ncbi:MAG: TolC family protein [Cytophagaceae bacterium]|nr:TolC family protein [Cytophagaceae bacterium]
MKKLVNIYILALVIIVSPAYSQTYSLEQCLNIASEHNKTLQIAANNQHISELKHNEANANLWPKLTFGSDYKYFSELPTQLLPAVVFGGQPGQFKEAQFGVPHNISAQIQFAMPLYQPQVIGASKMTSIGAEISGLQFQKSQQQLIYDISSLYFSLQLIGHQLTLIDKNIENTGKLLSNLQLLQTQQMAKGTDVEKVRLQMQQLTTQKEVLISRKIQLHNNLILMMGMPQEQNIEIDPTISLKEAALDDENQNIDYQIVMTQNKLLKRELKTLKTLTLPSLNLVGAYGTTGFGYDTAPNDFLRFYPVSFAGLQLSLPIFSGGGNFQKIKQKKLEITNSHLQADLVRDQTTIQIKNLRSQISTSLQQIELTQKQKELAQTIYDQTLLQQKQGLAALTEVLLADNAMRDAQQSHLNALVDYLKSIAELRKISGNVNVKK